MRLEELRELPLPPTNVAEGAWDAARRRRRRTTVATVAVAAALVGSTAVGVGIARDGDNAPSPSPAPAPPSIAPTSPTTAPTLPTSPTSPTAPTSPTSPTINPLPHYEALARSMSTEAATDPSNLSSDPVHRGVMAIVPTYDGGPRPWDVVDVLGDDGRWRYVDVPGLEPTHDEVGYQFYAIVPTSLRWDGTRLALPQQDHVVVVDLTTGDYQSYDVPGPNVGVVWQDASHVLVTEEGRPTGKLLDLDDGTVVLSERSANTAFLPDGSWLTWGYGGTLTSSDGTRVTAEVANATGDQRTSPLVDDAVAVGLGVIKNVDDQGNSQTGVAVVDRHSGKLLAFLPTRQPGPDSDSTYLLALNDDRVTLAVGLENGSRIVVRWDWRTGDVTPVEVVEAGMISGSPE